MPIFCYNDSVKQKNERGKPMTTLFLHLVNMYNAIAYTHLYIFGFEYKGLVYMVHTDSRLLPSLLTLDRASRETGYSIRFKPTTKQKLFLLSHATVLCSKEFFNAQVANSKYNRGEVFEKLVTEHFGQTWVKDNIPFTKAGDIEVNGVAYQIKYEKATFASEKSLARLNH